MRRTEFIALILSLIAVGVSYIVADRVFDRMAHLEDEMAYVWQAQVIARGQLTTPIPPEPKSFLVPFVVDYNGHRFGKYPLGWPVVLALGVFFDLRSWVNPLLAGLGVWLTYRLGQRLLGGVVGVLAAGLTITSPFFLVNSGSLLSHPLGLVLSTGFALAWLDAFGDRHTPPRWLPTLTAAACLAGLALTRPLTAVAVGLPFGLHGLYLLARGSWPVRRGVLVVGLIALALGALHFLWQYAVTGDPTLNPYTLWWEYDSIGFRPGVGRDEEGHTLHQALINTRHSLKGGFPDLFGWGAFSWIFLPIGLLAILRNGKALLAASVFPCLVVVYLVYWIGSSLFGPRYYYEGLYSLTLVSGAGIAWLAGWPIRPGSPDSPERPVRSLGGRSWLRPALVSLGLAGLVAVNFTTYLPTRLEGMHGLYGVSRERLEPFLNPQTQKYAPALIIVHPEKKWTEYGSLVELSDPFHDTPFVFVHSRGPQNDAEVAAAFPDRNVYHYYPAEPYTFYTRVE